MRIRFAVVKDVAEICRIEAIPEYRAFISSTSAEDHLKALDDPDIRYLAIVDEADVLQGYAILWGLTSPHRSVLLKRIAVGEPEKGYGRKLLAEAARFAFDECGAHRLWLDVFVTNTRAKHVYENFGFQVEGLFRESKYRDGQYYSQFLMSMLEDEYREKWGATASKAK